MSKLEEIQAQIAAIQTSADNIAADIERLIGKITGGLSPDEATAVISDLTAISDKLRGISEIDPG